MREEPLERTRDETACVLFDPVFVLMAYGRCSRRERPSIRKSWRDDSII